VAILYLCLKQKPTTSRGPASFIQPVAHTYAAVPPAPTQYQAQYPQNQYGYHPDLTGVTASPVSPGQQWNPYKPSNATGNQESYPQELPAQNT
jgi:hypothetical protein